MVGRHNARCGAKRIFDISQKEQWNRHFLYCCLDKVFILMFPEQFKAGRTDINMESGSSPVGKMAGDAQTAGMKARPQSPSPQASVFSEPQQPEKPAKAGQKGLRRCEYHERATDATHYSPIFQPVMSNPVRIPKWRTLASTHPQTLFSGYLRVRRQQQLF